MRQKFGRSALGFMSGWSNELEQRLTIDDSAATSLMPDEESHELRQFQVDFGALEAIALRLATGRLWHGQNARGLQLG